jgi:hypothetical protein
MLARQIAVGGAGFVAAFAIVGAVLFFTEQRQVKCNSTDVVNTVKDLAQQRLRSLSSIRILLTNNGGGSSDDLREIERLAVFGYPLAFELDAFRDRGAVGSGASCAAFLYVMRIGQRTFQFSSEYSVEPTTDGKTIVTARFMPNT